MSRDDAPTTTPPAWLALLLLVVTTVGTDAVWLAWDQEYQRDPVTGVSSGPYEAWQVVGCALTLGAVALVAGLRQRPWLALAVVPSVFTLVFSLRAAPEDESGLWVVGAMLLLMGTFAGTAAIAFPAAARAEARARPR